MSSHLYIPVWRKAQIIHSLFFSVLQSLSKLLLFQRILPLEGDNDLFPPPQHEPKSNNVFTIRPYFPDDKVHSYIKKLLVSLLGVHKLCSII